MIIDDLLYYTNGHGAVAVGPEGEDFIFLPNGRLVALEDPWREADEELPSKVTPKQLEALQELLAARELRALEKAELAKKREEEHQAAIAWVDSLFEERPPSPEFEIVDLFGDGDD